MRSRVGRAVLRRHRTAGTRSSSSQRVAEMPDRSTRSDDTV